MDQPNVLVILSDQHRRDSLGCYGLEEIRTPAFDRLAAEGLRFTHCMSGSPVCSPFRASFQTGVYPHQHGIVHNNLYIDRSLPSLGTCFRDAGYRTGYIGKSHWWGDGKPGFVPPEARLGWETWHGFNRGHFHFDTPAFESDGNRIHPYTGRYEPEVHTDLALAFMQTGDDQPWILHLNWSPPHTQTMSEFYADPDVRDRCKALGEELGFHLEDKDFSTIGEPWFPQHLVGPLVPERYLAMYDPATISPPPNVRDADIPMAKYYLREYYAMITSLDDQLERILAFLDESGQADSTLILYTSDHGDYVGSHGVGRSKAQPHQHPLRTPLLMRGPGISGTGRTTESLCNTVDFLPTLLDLAGLDRPDGLEGVSQAPVAHDQRDTVQEELLLGLGSWRGLYDGRWLFSATFENGQPCPNRLIHTQDDPWDLKNLAETPCEAQRVADATARLRDRLAAVHDPILTPKEL